LKLGLGGFDFGDGWPFDVELSNEFVPCVSLGGGELVFEPGVGFATVLEMLAEYV